MTTNDSGKYYCLDIITVKKALTTLGSVRSHEHFPGYLALLRDRSTSNIVSNSDDIVNFYKKFLKIVDAPDKSPYLRPFRSRGVGNPLTLYQKNVAGSYAPSSIREKGPLSKIINIEQPSGALSYKLSDEHWKVVLSEMLSGHRLPIVSTIVFLFRDYAFRMFNPNLENLVLVFRAQFSILTEDENGDDIYETIFRDDFSEYSDEHFLEVEPERSGSDNIIKIRDLKLADLDLSNLLRLNAMGNTRGSHQKMEIKDVTLLDENDNVLKQVNRAFELGYAGVLISGSPGTGKSWYAQQIGVALSGSWEAVRTVQFHPSYQYEDFIFGYVAQKDGTFLISAKEFVLACRAAAVDPDRIHILIIDEISRTDIIRVFGEVLTYLERDKRDQPFKTASGEELSVPSNLMLIGTMNPWDRGVDEIDIALERRFAQIDINPSADVLRKLLSKKTTEPFINKIIAFFEKLNMYESEEIRLGHAYFLGCIDLEAALDIWSFRIKPTLKRACRFNAALFEQIELDWQNIVVDASHGDVGNAEPDKVLSPAEQSLKVNE
ncbi:McrB family protein [Paenibacillus harenae]|uniref:McrB family protein n=1 Tax=Paenibacillus harenae TaxID=306543 RepID=UPI0003F87470|nr:AAA family ATPase [Paenibacillus harenae]